VDVEFATSIGLDEDALSKLMSDVGFAKAGDAWRWRGRHAGKRQERREAGSHAFAELAKLRHK
jgi:ATP-dependent RNA helicase SUPV3L1/SUV3